MELCKARFTFVASNFTIMRDYRKHLTLLPHKWQVVGIIGACIVLIPYIIIHQRIFQLRSGVIQAGSPELTALNELVWWHYLTQILVSVFLMICCLSKEKEEDEYTISVRYRALTIAIIVFFLSRAGREMIYGGFHTMVNNIFLAVNRFNNFDPMRAMRDYNIGSPLLIGLDRVVGFFSSLFVVEILYIVLLKVLARFGSGNRFNSILFLNHYRKIGWLMLPFSLLLIPLTVFLLLYSFRGKDPQVVEGVYRTTMRLTILLPYIAIMLICLSKEKQEDEFIRHIRARILAYFAIYYMVMSFIITNVSYILMNAINRIALSLESSNRFIAYNVTIGILPVLIWVPVVAVVYALVLKRVLSKNLKESNNEE